MEEKPKYKIMSLRLREKVYDQLQKLSEKDCRSMAAEINVIISERYERDIEAKK